MRRRAFSLVELLVVVVITGLLMALLLPAVLAARQAARDAECQSNLHQISVHIAQYTDHRGKLPTIPNNTTFPVGNCPSVIAAQPQLLRTYIILFSRCTRESIMESQGRASVDIVLVRDLLEAHHQGAYCLYLDGHVAWRESL